MKVRLFKALAAHPIARDFRINLDWHKIDKPGKYALQAPLKGNRKVTMFWRPNKELERKLGGWRRCDGPRAPNALEMNTLLYLLHEAARNNPCQYNSVSAIAGAAHGPTQSVYLETVLDSLMLWNQLGIHFGAQHGFFPPPINEIKIKEGYRPHHMPSFSITMNKKWIEACKSGGFSANLPLPQVATAQNIVLYTLYLGSAIAVNINQFFWHVSGNKRGLKPTPHTPYTSWVVAKKYYEKHNGSVEYRRLPYTTRVASRTRSDRSPIVQVPSTLMHIEVERPTWQPKPKDTWQNRRNRLPQASA